MNKRLLKVALILAAFCSQEGYSIGPKNINVGAANNIGAKGGIPQKQFNILSKPLGDYEEFLSNQGVSKEARTTFLALFSPGSASQNILDQMAHNPHQHDANVIRWAGVLDTVATCLIPGFTSKRNAIQDPLGEIRASVPDNKELVGEINARWAFLQTKEKTYETTCLNLARGAILLYNKLNKQLSSLAWICHSEEGAPSAFYNVFLVSFASSLGNFINQEMDIQKQIASLQGTGWTNSQTLGEAEVDPELQAALRLSEETRRQEEEEERELDLALKASKEEAERARKEQEKKDAEFAAQIAAEDQ